MQHVTSNNVGSFWPTMLRPFAYILRQLKCCQTTQRWVEMVTAVKKSTKTVVKYRVCTRLEYPWLRVLFQALESP